ncbi:MAG TPA: deoxyribodipyrimidine photo-lyase [Flavobacteriales bacterium]|nr:deoxyribodipyrimidine photo-lyase [Flavobacteriales bacterium]
MQATSISIFWHRRDLRNFDNAGLYHALKENKNVLPLFIFDSTILDELEDKTDARVNFIYNEIERLKTAYEKQGSSLLVKFGKPLDVWKLLISEFDIKAVFTNRDYEPYAQDRDKDVYTFLQKKKIDFKGYKDHVIFEKNEILKPDSTPYSIFTPYSRKWLEKLDAFYLKSYPTEIYFKSLFKTKPLKMLSLGEIGFKKTGIAFPGRETPLAILKKYETTRDLPAVNGTSRLSIHLRFGTISIRQLATQARKLNAKFFGELIWRDFYQMILFHYPSTVTHAFKPKYDRIKWRNNETEYDLWCQGKTGYPLVDAGMRELNTTGHMHNRVRMVVASFLTKHLLIDWRWGEAYFAKKLLDFELASNVGGWQWAAGCGCDAAPYFRVFNPALQTKKFDPEFTYIKKWVPEFGTEKYCKPIVEHEFARKRILEVFKNALEGS